MKNIKKCIVCFTLIISSVLSVFSAAADSSPGTITPADRILFREIGNTFKNVLPLVVIFDDIEGEITNLNNEEYIGECLYWINEINSSPSSPVFKSGGKYSLNPDYSFDYPESLFLYERISAIANSNIFEQFLSGIAMGVLSMPYTVYKSMVDAVVDSSIEAVDEARSTTHSSGSGGTHGGGGRHRDEDGNRVVQSGAESVVIGGYTFGLTKTLDDNILDAFSSKYATHPEYNIKFIPCFFYNDILYILRYKKLDVYSKYAVESYWGVSLLHVPSARDGEGSTFNRFTVYYDSGIYLTNTYSKTYLMHDYYSKQPFEYYRNLSPMLADENGDGSIIMFKSTLGFNIYLRNTYVNTNTAEIESLSEIGISDVELIDNFRFIYLEDWFVSPYFNITDGFDSFFNKLILKKETAVEDNITNITIPKTYIEITIDNSITNNIVINENPVVVIDDDGKITVDDIPFENLEDPAVIEEPIDPPDEPPPSEDKNLIIGILEKILAELESINDRLNTWLTDLLQFIESVIIINLLKDILDELKSWLGEFVLELVAVSLVFTNSMKDLFIPDENYFSNYFNDFKIRIENKVPIVNQVIQLQNDVFGQIENSSDELPKVEMNIFGATVTIFDLTYIAEFMPYIHGVILAVSYFFFIRKLIKKIISVLRGL